MKRSSTLLSRLFNATSRWSLTLFIIAALISGCATGRVATTGGTAAEALPSPGATVAVGTITAEIGKHTEFNLSKLLAESLTTALKEEQILWPGDATPRFILNARIIDYEPGNAFKRWVLPGWGSTVLEIRSEMQLPGSDTVAAVIENKRSVFAGGAYTIGAWKSIFDSAASDLASELKTRINGGGFVVSLTPYAEMTPGVQQTPVPIEIVIPPFRDARADKLRLGERTAAFSTKMGDIYPNRNVGSYLTETLADGLRAMGHKVGGTAGGVTIQGEVNTFRVETPASMLYWDVTTEIGLTLRFTRSGRKSEASRSYAARSTERTYAWPSAGLIEKTLGAAVADVMGQIQKDTIWNSLAPGDKGP